jgi:DNA-binding beta-propeller fold protein YncE
VTTRRSFFGGAAAAGAAQLISGPLLADAKERPERCAPVSPGMRTGGLAVTADGRTIWSTDSASTTITAHRRSDLARGRSIDVGGAPLGIAISPRAGIALVTTAFYDRPGLAIVDLLSGHVERVDVGPEPYTVAFDRHGHSAYVVGGGRDGTLVRVHPRTGRVDDPVDLGKHPRGFALHPDGAHALVAINGAHHIAVVSLVKGKVVRRIETRPFPYLLAASPDARRALVTHNGFADDAATLLDLEHWHVRRTVRVGADPAGVAFSRAGRVAVVAASGARTVTLLDGRSGRRRRTLTNVGIAHSLVIAGGRAIVADGLNGDLKAIRL